jgi:histidinol-phosphate aminotransferase
MLPQPQPFLAQIQRTIDAGSDIIPLVCLDRNERVDPFPDWFMHKMQKLVTSKVCNTYPIQESLIQELILQKNLGSDQILLTPGIDGAIRSFFHAYVKPGDKVACLRPSYMMYELYAKMFGAEVIPVEFNEKMKVDLSAMGRAAAEAKYFFIANPNQPTGTYFDKEIINNLLEIIRKNDGILILDEAYVQFVGKSWVEDITTQSNLLVLQTFSKAYGLAGFRVGWAAGPIEVIENMRKVRSAYDINSVAILFAEQLLLEPIILEKNLESIRAGKQLLINEAIKLGLVPIDTYTNFLLLKASKEIDVIKLKNYLKYHGYIIKSYNNISCMNNMLRITIGSPNIIQSFCTIFSKGVKSILN